MTLPWSGRDHALLAVATDQQPVVDQREAAALAVGVQLQEAGPIRRADGRLGYVQVQVLRRSGTISGGFSSCC